MCERDPKYRRQRKAKGSDLAFVEVQGTRIYLGAYGTVESKEGYRRTLLEWKANGKRLPVKPDAVTIVELISRFWAHAEQYYRHPDGRPTGTAVNFRTALRLLKELYGSTLATDFGPLALKALRERFIESGLSRGQVNKEVSRIRQVFKFAVGEGLLEERVYASLQVVPGLKRGRSPARETDPIAPVPEAHVQAVEGCVSRQVWALIQLQLLTGARGGELFPMRRCDLDDSGSVWTYTPVEHKTAYRGHQRVIYFGPRAQHVLRLFLNRPPAAYLFSPREATEEFAAKRSRERVTPLKWGNKPGTNRVASPKKKPGAHYTRRSYYEAIQRACKRAKVPHWHPHQLRHNAATALRKEFGLDVARVILGHRSAAITEMYAELDREGALTAMKEFG